MFNGLILGLIGYFAVAGCICVAMYFGTRL